MKKLILPTILIIHLYILYNLQFTPWPEMYSYPYLVNNGFKLYKDIIHPYPPLLTTILAKLYLYFGYSLWNLKIFTWSLLLINDLLIFSLAKKLTKNKIQIYLSLIFYIFTQSILEGNMMWFDVAITTPLLAALLFCLKANSAKKIYVKNNFLMLLGFMLAICVLIKQTTGLFLIAFLVLLILQKTKLKQLLHFSFAPILLGLSTLIKLYSKGGLTEFLNWNLLYPFQYWSKFPGYVNMHLSSQQALILLLLIIPSLAALFLIYKSNQKYYFSILLIYLLISLIIIYPRFSFFHFQLGIAVSAILLSKLSKYFSSLIIAIFVLLFFIPQYKALSAYPDRFIGEEEYKLSRNISEHVGDNESVYLLNIHSVHYHLSNRLPPRPWFDNFGWYLEIPGVQEEVLLRWNQNPPDYIYFQAPEPGAWHELGTYVPKQITSWISENYESIDTYGDNIQIYRYNSYVIASEAEGSETNTDSSTYYVRSE